MAMIVQNRVGKSGLSINPAAQAFEQRSNDRKCGLLTTGDHRSLTMDDNQLLRYGRQILLPQIDIAGQERLLAARVLIIGLGGLGSPAALYLAAAGVGHLVINDFDRVDLSNLQRQILHKTPSIGQPKTSSALQELKAINPEIDVQAIDGQLDSEALAQAVAAVDLVLDCSDNLKTRFAVNTACHRHQTRLVSGAVIRFEGQIAVFWPGVGQSPCYNCLYPYDNETVDSCAHNGVIAPLPGIIGSMQALEAIKLLAMPDYDPPASLMLFDALTLDWQRFALTRNPHCCTCGSSA